MSDDALDPRQLCTGLLLAGGRGSRLGGADKGLVELHGQPLARWSYDALLPQLRSVMISANRNHDLYAQFGVPVIADQLADFQGPLAGMHAGLEQCATPWLLCVPCDMPAIPSTLALELLRAAVTQSRPAAYAVVGGEASYICALLHSSLRQPLENFLGTGERAVRRWLNQCGAIAVDFPTMRPAHLNINTPAQLAAAAAG